MVWKCDCEIFYHRVMTYSSMSLVIILLVVNVHAQCAVKSKQHYRHSQNPITILLKSQWSNVFSAVKQIKRIFMSIEWLPFFDTPSVCIKKKTTLNIHEYSLCFYRKKTFGPWDLRRIVIIFCRYNYLNKVGCINQLWIEIYISEYSWIFSGCLFIYTLFYSGVLRVCNKTFGINMDIEGTIVAQY